jgi:thiol-disulfide isomerase/thioredoxin
MRRLLGALAALALVAVVIVGLGQAGGGDEPQAAPPPPFDLAEAREALRGAPGPLARLHADANELLDGAAFEARMEELEGRPVVINKWASWCGPCRAEFPIFQRVATERGKQIAFLGLNAGDERPAAEKFLAERPLPYPSYEDPEEEIARELKVAKYFPITLFVDERGKTFSHAGEYKSTADLEADIDRYLG